MRAFATAGAETVQVRHLKEVDQHVGASLDNMRILGDVLEECEIQCHRTWKIKWKLVYTGIRRIYIGSEGYLKGQRTKQVQIQALKSHGNPSYLYFQSTTQNR